MLRTLLVNIEKDSRRTINDVSFHHAISCAVVRVVSCYDAKQVINYRLDNSVKAFLTRRQVRSPKARILRKSSYPRWRGPDEMGTFVILAQRVLRGLLLPTQNIILVLYLFLLLLVFNESFYSVLDFWTWWRSILAVWLRARSEGLEQNSIHFS